MKNLFKRGFTLIELLVVIAIIGILASIVITNLSSSRNKAKDSSAKVSMASMRAQAETVTMGSGNYPQNICSKTSGAPLASLMAAVDGEVPTAGATVCQTTPTTPDATGATSWAVHAGLNDTVNTDFCVDSSGFSGKGTLASGVSACTPTP